MLRSATERQIFNEVKNAAYRIIKGKGATSYAIGLALTEIVESIIRDEHSVLTVSSLLTGEYGLADLCLSVPAIVNRNGIVKKLILSLAPEEEAGFLHSGAVLKEIQNKLEI